MPEYLSSDHLFLLITMSLVGAAVGFAANIIGCWITYGINKDYPQGLIHYKRNEFARLLYKHTIKGRISISQLYEQMGPEKMVKQAVRCINPHLDTILDTTLEDNHEIFWENIPTTIKHSFYNRAHKLFPRIMDNVVEHISDHMARFTKLEKTSRQKLANADTSIAWIIKQCYQKDLKKLPLKGAITGCIMGLVLFFGWLIAPGALTLILGYGSIACISVWIGLSGISRLSIDTRALSKHLAAQTFSPASIMNSVLLGNNTKRTYALFKKHTSVIIERPSLRAFAQLTIGPSGYADVKQQLAKKITTHYLTAINEPRFTKSQQQRIENYLALNINPEDTPAELLSKEIHKAQTIVLIPAAAVVGYLAGFIVFICI